MKVTYNQHLFETTSIPAFLLIGLGNQRKPRIKISISGTSSWYSWITDFHIANQKRKRQEAEHISFPLKKVSEMSFRNQSLKRSHDEEGVILTHHMVKQPFSVSVRGMRKMRVLSRESLGFWNPPGRPVCSFACNSEVGFFLRRGWPGDPYKRSFKKKKVVENMLRWGKSS